MKDERPTSNFQRPTSNEKTNREAGRLESWEVRKLEDKGRLVKLRARGMGKKVAFGFRIAERGKVRLTINNGQLTIP